MRLVVAAVGRLKDGPERELAERYRKRAEQTRPPHRLSRHRDRRDPRKPRPGGRQAHDRGIDRARQRDPRQSRRSSSSTSAAKASTARRSQSSSAAGATTAGPAAVFIIGGDDGLAPSAARQGERCDSRSAPPPGRTSWCGCMLLEQIYRADHHPVRASLSSRLEAICISRLAWTRPVDAYLNRR